MKTAYQLYKEELKVNKELYSLGLISHVDKLTLDVKARYLYMSQKSDSN